MNLWQSLRVSRLQRELRELSIRLVLIGQIRDRARGAGHANGVMAMLDSELALTRVNRMRVFKKLERLV